MTLQLLNSQVPTFMLRGDFPPSSLFWLQKSLQHVAMNPFLKMFIKPYHCLHHYLFHLNFVQHRLNYDVTYLVIQKCETFVDWVNLLFFHCSILKSVPQSLNISTELHVDEPNAHRQKQPTIFGIQKQESVNHTCQNVRLKNIF